ncbi:MAG: hypothetical protein AB1757_01825 [Acidobacteriota bacterium]
MRCLKNRVTLLLALLSLIIPFQAFAQWDKKPYTEWTEKEAQKLLNDSPWGRTQVYTSNVSLFRGPTSGRVGVNSPTSANTDTATHLNFRIRFLSAKPIRQAIARLLEVKQKQSLSNELAAHLKSIVEGEFLEYIVITVSVDSQQVGSNVQEAYGLLQSRGTAVLKNNTYLEIKGGKRIFLHEYQPPKPDGLGARFIFQRLVDGKPFITPESEEIHFFTELNNTYRLDRRYKVKDMMYEGKLEY